MMHQLYPQVFHDYCYELNKDMHIAAAHFIPHQLAGKCAHIHGHTYVVNITVAGDALDETGFLVNFQKLKQLVHGKLDHTLLNDHQDWFDSKNSEHFPTTEIVARKIYEVVQDYLDALPHKPKCLQVFVRETPTSYVVYRPKAGDR
ncbi:6-carboxytetrahydropterin synthase QueD [Anoxybacillus rupiensis]|jgi:6-pyruvoyltetrahydropterin/6-carboxytetrahydropterin synthase|uniref:6-carboxy-5,6,7,8-tetrahydropterin synthase n=1 Tax=Anoxybacteroides rupiense TaxID=311460 RepID=A0ABD5IZ16_9BACL|nr:MULTISPECIES: 6-carboxytetrahydropterin synthase QueD [Anoxybacillus]MBB3906385.1 6-pyruvoyltetrahydropterin/6-carboxytetrahydropterin synthase [Anoxybacillus rupiensis]MBS2770633.1 6-carboxytetrahydropterin synthase QueD [Anoxybacillus rupiensis]MDE8564350.1 6-carboxytetrahydropterin synthase QueD [Anoxybacillus rupiensis]MED5053468.1 6-carboxytetrahydropterin synthase QueD [Anoxybacillus rupiensis]OQM44221.1 6-carboxytetrahydropterin synthase QueD [Anoxybacillus sp. UARK-01]